MVSRRILAALLLVAALAGCSEAVETSAGPEAVVAVPGRALAFPAALPAKSEGFCPVATPESWRAAFTAGLFAAKRDEILVGQAISTDGATAVATSVDPDYQHHRVVVLRDHGTSRTLLYSGGADEQLAGAAVDGQRVVFGVGPAGQDLGGAWTLYAWDSTSRKVERIGANPSGGHVDLAPVLVGDTAAWVAAVPGGKAAVHLYDLAARKDRVVHTGHPGEAFRVDNLLVWPEDGAGLRAVDLRTGAPAALPGPLATVSGGHDYSANGGTVAWASGFDTITARRAAGSVTVRRAGDAQLPGASGDIVTWTEPSGAYAADLRSGSFARIAPVAGGTVVAGDWLLIDSSPGGKGQAGGYLYAVRASTLSALPRCA